MYVCNPTEVEARLEEESVAGVILDRRAYARLPAGQLRTWLIVGAGRAVVGLDLTTGLLQADADGSVPADSSLPSPYLGSPYVGYLSFRASPRGGACGEAA